MLEEATNKLQGIERHGSLAAAPLLFVAEVDFGVLDLDDAAVRDGHAEDIRGQVFEDRFTTADRLAIDVPIDLPA